MEPFWGVQCFGSSRGSGKRDLLQVWGLTSQVGLSDCGVGLGDELEPCELQGHTWNRKSLQFDGLYLLVRGKDC